MDARSDRSHGYQAKESQYRAACSNVTEIDIFQAAIFKHAISDHLEHVWKGIVQQIVPVGGGNPADHEEGAGQRDHEIGEWMHHALGKAALMCSTGDDEAECRRK